MSRKCLLLIMVMCLTLFGQYSASPTSTTTGNGTWGSILKLTCSISGSNGTFVVSKQDNSAFSSGTTIQLKVGTYESYGANCGASYTTTNSTTSTITRTFDFSTVTGFPKDYYMRTSNTAGGSA